jgi:hypothetical protein
VYDVDSARQYAYGRGERWDAPALKTGRWYTIDLYLQLNTPGHRNGTLRTLVDGRQVFHATGYRFRRVDDLDVGSAWFDVYYGGEGTAPVDMLVDLDDVLLEWD